MKLTMKALFLSGVLAIAGLFALPNVSDAHWGRGGRPWVGYYGSYHYPAPYRSYYYGYYPGYYSYYTPGWTTYSYGYRPYGYYGYYGYRPHTALRVGPVGVWW